MSKVFLGGTCNESKWRDILIPMLEVDYFNPVVKDWTPECQQEEARQKNLCNLHLYVITPKMKGVYSIAEVSVGAVQENFNILFVVIKKDEELSFDKTQLKLLEATQKLLTAVSSRIITMTLDEYDQIENVADHLNNYYKV